MPKMDWTKDFDDRERQEIALCCVYHDEFNHGAPGHNRMVIISKMVSVLNSAESVINKAHEKEKP